MISPVFGSLRWSGAKEGQKDHSLKFCSDLAGVQYHAIRPVFISPYSEFSNIENSANIWCSVYCYPLLVKINHGPAGRVQNILVVMDVDHQCLGATKGDLCLLPQAVTHDFQNRHPYAVSRIQIAISNNKIQLRHIIPSRQKICRNRFLKKLRATAVCSSPPHATSIITSTIKIQNMMIFVLAVMILPRSWIFHNLLAIKTWWSRKKSNLTNF